MHYLKVLILGSSSFSSTLNELKTFLKFNLVEEKNYNKITIWILRQSGRHINEY